MALYDVDEKKRRGYKDRASKVRYDGSEILEGKDWTQRKRELWERCGGRCEFTDFSVFPPQRCQNEGHDPHHLKMRSEGRDDRLTNLLCVCRSCHIALDNRKLKWTKKEKP